MAPLIRAHAQSVAAREPSIAGCWISPGWSKGLTWEGHPEWRDASEDADDGDRGVPSLICVFVAREVRYTKVSVCGYLVDAQCLGVKNVLGPRVIERYELDALVRRYFQAYDEPPQVVPFDLVQELVLGAEAYARKLGFEPHPEFEACRAHLGTWTASSAIRFGWHGKPFFSQGPNDDARTVMRTLERSVGRGNFDFMAVG